MQNAKNSAFINLPELGGAQHRAVSIDPVLVSKQRSKSSATQFVIISQNESHASIEMFSIYLIGKNLITSSTDFDHRIFKKSSEVSEKIPFDFPDKH